MAGTDWSPESVKPTDWGGVSRSPTDFAPVAPYADNWNRNQNDILQGAVTITYDEATLTYDDLNTFYDGYDPAGATSMDLYPTDYAGVANKPTDWQEVT